MARCFKASSRWVGVRIARASLSAACAKAMAFARFCASESFGSACRARMAFWNLARPASIRAFWAALRSKPVEAPAAPVWDGAAGAGPTGESIKRDAAASGTVSQARRGCVSVISFLPKRLRASLPFVPAFPIQKRKGGGECSRLP